MAITFTRAPVVNVGDKIEAWQHIQLANAFNDRLRSGIGDPTWRIFYYLFSMFRQIRNSDGLYTFPSMAEFFEFYQNISPFDARWPLAGIGDPEGARIGCQIVQWMAGNTGAFLPEAERVFPLQNEDPSTVAAGWALAKIQRGAYDPTTKAMAAPALDVSRSRWNMVFSTKSFDAMSYGGFAPVPEVMTYLGGNDCGDGTTDEPPTLNYKIKFTNTITGEVVEYPGTCPMEPEHVAWTYPAPWGYYVSQNNGNVDFYPINQWIEGPYTSAGRLRRQPSQLMERVLNYFASEFHGSDSQRKGEYDIAHAFDIQSFLSQHYKLAPQYGEQVGESIYEKYPTFVFTGSTAKGTKAKYEGAENYAYHENFVCLGFRITASSQTSSGQIEIRDGEAVVSTASFSGGTDSILWIDARRFAALNVVAASSFTGTVTLEFLETLDYHPGIDDLALILRCGSANDSGAVDGRGIDCERAKEIWNTYSAYGCMAVGYLPMVSSEINGNAIYDAARRLSKMVRCMPRHQILKYAVIDGKSVCWFKRYAMGMSLGVQNDLFDGIADAIAHDAPVNGYSNEWLMGVQFKVYSPSDSSIWKPDAYSDYYPLVNRCVFRPHTPVDSEIARQFGYSDALLYTPEAPSGYNYAKDIQWDASYLSESFYKSCRIYEPDAEIESAVTETIDGEAAVKVTFTGRFHHCDEAPESISDDWSIWDTAALDAEPYRTTENGLRQYILRYFTGKHCTQMVGDSAGASSVWTEPDNPFGACYPHFIFTKLIPKPHVQTDRPYSEGTPLLHDPFIQMDIYLRAMCEGFVDGATTKESICDCVDDGLNQCGTYDFTFENLCFQALGRRWLWTIPNEDGVNVQGFGPLPTTYARAEIFNQFSKCVNLLTKARVMLPVKFQVQEHNGTRSFPVQSLNADGTPATFPCVTSSFREYWDGTVQDVSTLADGTWSDAATGSTAEVTASMDEDTPCLSSLRNIKVSRRNVSWRVAIEDATQENAIPESWRDMILTNCGVPIVITRESISTTKRLVPAGTSTTLCDGAAWVNGSNEWQFDQHSPAPELECVVESAGEIVPDPLGRNSFAFAANSSGVVCPILGGSNTVSVAPKQVDSCFISIPYAI